MRERLTQKKRDITNQDVKGITESGFVEQTRVILNKFRDVIALPGEKLGCTNLVKANIDTGNHKPIFTRQYPLAHKTKENLDAVVTEMLEEGIIQPSKSPWNSPMILVKKKDGSFRPCVDFRKLNEITTSDKYPLPRIQELLQSLHGSKFFTTLDLQSSYWQTEIEDEDKEKTAFSTNAGHWNFTRMPFGLKNAPAIFSRLMSIVLAGLIGTAVFVYIDDIIIASKTKEEHIKTLNTVLELIERRQFKNKIK